MKILSIKTIPVSVPRRDILGVGFKSSLGTLTVSEYVIVFVETDAGITGVGEASSVFSRRGRLMQQEIAAVLAPALIGEDPFEVSRLVARMDERLDGAEPAKAALDMALWDIKGKALGTPVYNLLGGAVRDRVGLSFSIPFAQPDDAAKLARTLVQDGFRTLKVKVGRDLLNDVETVRCVRDAVGPDIKIRVDANMAFHEPKTAIDFIRKIEPYALEFVEQPLPPRALEAMAYVRSQVTVRIMADESVWTPQDAREVIRHGAADVVNVYVSESGGLLNAWRTFTLCEAAGIPCMIGSMPELGVGTAAIIHLGMAMMNLSIDSDACGTLYHGADLLARPLRIENGYAYPPEGPGLGVEIDHEALQRWSDPD